MVYQTLVGLGLGLGLGYQDKLHSTTTQVWLRICGAARVEWPTRLLECFISRIVRPAGEMALLEILHHICAVSLLRSCATLQPKDL